MPAPLRYRCALLALVTCTGILIGGPSQSQAGVFLDLNFDGLQNGEPIPTTTPSVDPIPIHRAYSTNGFTNSGIYSGTNNVASNVGNLLNAVLMSTNQGGTGANFIDTQFLVPGSLVSLDFDIHIVAQSFDEVAYPQATANFSSGQLFAINAFALDTNRVFRFAVTPTSDQEGFFALRDERLGTGELNAFFSYTVGTDYHVSILANYLTNTVNASVTSSGGTGSISDIPFVTSQPINGGMSEFFIFQNNIEGLLNQIALDNIVGATLAPVPEPSSLAIFAIGSLCCAGFARRRGRSTLVATEC